MFVPCLMTDNYYYDRQSLAVFKTFSCRRINSVAGKYYK